MIANTPTPEACSSFLADMAMDKEYGPLPLCHTPQTLRFSRRVFCFPARLPAQSAVIAQVANYTLDIGALDADVLEDTHRLARLLA